MIRGYKFENQNTIRWFNDRPVEYKNGRFRYSFDEPMKEHYLKVIADGYEPEISRAFLSNEGAVGFDFSMGKGWCCSGVAIDAEGTVRVAERSHPDVASSRNQILVLANDGMLIERIALKHSPSNIVFDSIAGRYWTGGYGGVSRIDPDGNVDQPFDTQKAHVSAGRDGIWIIDKSGLKRLDQDDQPLITVKLKSEFDQYNVQSIE